jgi:hypothetical protein
MYGLFSGNYGGREVIFPLWDNINQIAGWLLILIFQSIATQSSLICISIAIVIVIAVAIVSVIVVVGTVIVIV